MRSRARPTPCVLSVMDTFLRAIIIANVGIFLKRDDICEVPRSHVYNGNVHGYFAPINNHTYTHMSWSKLRANHTNYFTARSDFLMVIRAISSQGWRLWGKLSGCRQGYGGGRRDRMAMASWPEEDKMMLKQNTIFVYRDVRVKYEDALVGLNFAVSSWNTNLKYRTKLIKFLIKIIPNFYFHAL